MSMNTARASLPYLPLALEADEKLEILVHNIQDLHSRICSYMKDEPSGPCKFYLFDSKDHSLAGEYASIEEARQHAEALSDNDHREMEHYPCSNSQTCPLDSHLYLLDRIHSRS